jgi:hypothetical protein
MAIEVRLWPKASFRRDAEFGCYQGVADIVRLAAGSTGSRMTQGGHQKSRMTLCFSNGYRDDDTPEGWKLGASSFFRLWN